jgi:hypothetical protein
MMLETEDEFEAKSSPVVAVVVRFVLSLSLFKFELATSVFGAMPFVEGEGRGHKYWTVPLLELEPTHPSRAMTLLQEGCTRISTRRPSNKEQ